MPRKIRDHDDALACLDAWEASEQSLATWSHAHDIDPRSLHCWKLNLRRQPKPRLVELVPATTTGTAHQDARYAIRFDGLELVVGDDFREDTLERLLAVLAC